MPTTTKVAKSTFRITTTVMDVSFARFTLSLQAFPASAAPT